MEQMGSTRKFLALCLLLVSAASAQSVNWVTRQFDNQRSGWNNQETIISQASVTKGLYLKTTIPLYGDARGTEGQPLIVKQVNTSKGVHDLLLACSMANQCRGVDAHTGADIWDVTLGNPINGSTKIDGWMINQHWGALPTGVVDLLSNRWYQVFWASPDGTAQNGRYYMAVINVTNGSFVVQPVMIDGTAQGYDFNAIMRKARSSAILINQNGTRTVIECTGTISETSNGAAGFCFAFDTYTNTVKAMISTTAGRGAGMWMAGNGLSADPASQYLYAITGNGDFDGVTQFGESFIQLRYVPPTATTAAVFGITKGYSPYTDFQRSGQASVPAGKLAGLSLPSMAVQPINKMESVSLRNAKLVSRFTLEKKYVTLVYPDMAQGPWADEDLGSGGQACIFQIGYCVASGKDGLAYVLPVPGFTGTTAATVGTVANCNYAKPVWLTTATGISTCPANPATLNFFPQGDTAHMHMTPVQMYDPVLKSWVLFAWGENNQLHKWAISNTGVLTWVANGHEYASANVRDNAPGGMPGGFCSGSSNGSDPNSAILVCAYPLGDANKTVTQGVLVVYDPIHLGADGYLQTLWSSATWGWNFDFNKFMPPMIDGGHIYYPNYNGGIMMLNPVGY